MTISYPLSLPTTRAPATIEIVARAAVGVAESEFTFHRQAQAHPGQAWAASVSLPPMSRADAEEWVAFLLSLNGPEGTFLLGDTAHATPRGTAGGTPLVNGGSQTGQDLITDGWTPGATLLKGDMIQIGLTTNTRLYKMLVDGTATGGGAMTLTLWPDLRSSPANNAPLFTAAPQSLFRLADTTTRWSIDEAKIYGLSFSAMEAL